jgi:predicted deacylase
VVKGTFAYSSVGGFFRKLSSAGDTVRHGDVMGSVIDHYGDTLEEFKAPQDGIVLWIRTRSAIFPGEEAVIFGEIVERINR